MTTTLTAEAAAFLDAVRAELADLPEDVLADLMDDVEQHLAEVLAEGDLADLGTPPAYAADLRSAAGLPPREDDGDGWAVVRTVRRRHARIAQTRAYREVVAFLPELRPAWWVARGYLLVVLFARAMEGDTRDVLPIPHISGNAFIGLILVGASVVASVRWGRRGGVRRGWRRTGLFVANAAAVLAAMVVFADVDNAAAPSYAYYYTSEPDGLYGPYGQIVDIKPYDRDGNPLYDVRLFDQDGRPLANQICDTYCQRLTFPLLPSIEDLMTTPTPTPAAPAPTATPTPSATPSR